MIGFPGEGNLPVLVPVLVQAHVVFRLAVVPHVVGLQLRLEIGKQMRERDGERTRHTARQRERERERQHTDHYIPGSRGRDRDINESERK